MIEQRRHEMAVKPKVLMLLTNAHDPDPRVHQEALSLIGMGCHVRLLAWDRDQKAPAFENMDGVEVDRVFLSSTHGRGNTQILFYVLLYLRMLWRGWRTEFDVLHAHDLDTLPLAFVLGKLKRRPIVYDAHESFPDMLSGSVNSAVIRGLIRLENFLIRRIDLLITVGEKLRRHFATRGATRSVVIGNWKRISEFHRSPEERAEMRQRLGIPQDAPVVVCITNLLPDRKIPELLDALEGCRDIHAIIGGKGVLESYVATRAQRNPRIHYLGFVPNRNIPAWTCTADMVYYGFDVNNPNARFSAPNKLFEALAAGRPLITGDFGEIAEVVRNAGCGIVLPEYTANQVRNALEKLRDRAVWECMATAARTVGHSAMNWEKAEETLYKEYSALSTVPLLPYPGSLGAAAGG